MNAKIMEEMKTIKDMNEIVGQLKEGQSALCWVKEVLVGADSGKKNTKVVISFVKDGERVVDEIELATTMVQTNSKANIDGVYEFIIDKKRYLIGDKSEKLNLEERNKRSKCLELHKNCILTGICALLKKHKITTSEVKIAVNMTLKDFTNLKEKEDLKKLYKNPCNTGIKVTFEGKEYTFKIKVLPYYEGIGALLNEKEKYENKRVISIDFGSYNTGYVAFENFKVQARDNESGTLNAGVNKLLSRIRVILRDNKHETITSDTQIFEVINEQNPHVSKGVVTLVHNEIINYLKEIYFELLDLDVDVKYADLLFSGGGAILYKNFIPKVFVEAAEQQSIHIVENPKFANAYGSLKLFAK